MTLLSHHKVDPIDNLKVTQLQRIIAKFTHYEAAGSQGIRPTYVMLTKEADNQCEEWGNQRFNLIHTNVTGFEKSVSFKNHIKTLG